MDSRLRPLVSGMQKKLTINPRALVAARMPRDFWRPIPTLPKSARSAGLLGFLLAYRKPNAPMIAPEMTVESFREQVLVVLLCERKEMLKMLCYVAAVKRYLTTTAHKQR
jgi:hypothetical protein